MKTNTLLCILGVPSGGTTVTAEILESWGYDGGVYGDGKYHECMDARTIFQGYWKWLDRKPHGSATAAGHRMYKYIQRRNLEEKQFFKCPYASLLLDSMNFSKVHINFIHVRRDLGAAINSAKTRWDKDYGPHSLNRWRETYRRINDRNERVIEKNHHEVIAEISYEGLVNSPQVELLKLSRPLGIKNDIALASCGIVKRELRHF